jgi:hypothetical protein
LVRILSAESRLVRRPSVKVTVHPARPPQPHFPQASRRPNSQKGHSFLPAQRKRSRSNTYVHEPVTDHFLSTASS